MAGVPATGGDAADYDAVSRKDLLEPGVFGQK